MDAAFAIEGLGLRKIARLDALVLRQPLRVQGRAGLNLFEHAQGTEHGFCPQPHHQAVTHGLRGAGLLHPACELLLPQWLHLVQPLARATRVQPTLRDDPPGLLHAGKFLVNLLMTGLPEESNRFVESSCKFVAR